MTFLFQNTDTTRHNPSNSNRRFGNLNNPNDLPDAEIWLNIGYLIGNTFISLPRGLPMDTMKDLDLRGNNEDWLKQVAARNNMRQEIARLGATLQPGEDRILFEQEAAGVVFQARVYRAKKPMADTMKPEDNEYAIAFPLLAAE